MVALPIPLLINYQKTLTSLRHSGTCRLPVTSHIWLTSMQMAPEVLYRVCYGASTITSAHPSHAAMKALTIAPAILQGFGRYKVQHADYPGMVASPGHSVRGTLVTGLTDRDIGRLDLFEGSEYDRVKVVVKTLEEEKDVEAATYVFKHVSYLEKEEWSYEEFRKQKMHRWADASEEYKGTL